MLYTESSSMLHHYVRFLKTGHDIKTLWQPVQDFHELLVLVFHHVSVGSQL